MNLRLMLCVNDPANGVFTGKVTAIEISPPGGDDILSLDGLGWRCTYIGTAITHWLRIGHVRVRCLSYGTWVGNWCWDCATVPLADVACLLAKMQRSKWWEIEEGEQALYDAWRGPYKDAGIWEALLMRAVKEQAV